MLWKVCTIGSHEYRETTPTISGLVHILKRIRYKAMYSLQAKDKVPISYVFGVIRTRVMRQLGLKLISVL